MFVWRMRLNVFKCIQTVRYSQGDVIGCHIELPEVPGQDYLPPTFKEIISPYENTKSDFLQRIEDFFFFFFTKSWVNGTGEWFETVKNAGP